MVARTNRSGRAEEVEQDASIASPDGDQSRLLTVPNVLSALRLGLVPVFIWLFLTGREKTAVLLYGVGASTDWLDGYIARRTNQISELGKLLDPLADRIYIAALVVVLTISGTLPLWLAAGVLGRDALLLALFPFVDRRSATRLSADGTHLSRCVRDHADLGQHPGNRLYPDGCGSRPLLDLRHHVRTCREVGPAARSD